MPFCISESPEILCPANLDFPGTFFVRYWLKDWQDILFGDEPLPAWVATSNPELNYLERILDAGFDGVYLDDVDGYERFNEESGDDTRPTAALEMLLFIRALSAWAKDRQPKFLVFQQNAEDLPNAAIEDLDEMGNNDGRLDSGDPYITVVDGVVYLDVDNDGDGDLSLADLDVDSDEAVSQTEIENAYFNAIDGLGAEDVFFWGDELENNKFIYTLSSPDPEIDDFKWTADNLLSYSEHDIPIFTVEYLRDPTIDDFFDTTKMIQYCLAVSDEFVFTNADITNEDDAPGFTNDERHSLTIIPFQAPSRDLDGLPLIPTPCVIIDPHFCLLSPGACLSIGEFQLKTTMAQDEARSVDTHLRKALHALIERQTGRAKSELEIAQTDNAKAKILVDNLIILRNQVAKQLGGEQL